MRGALYIWDLWGYHAIAWHMPMGTRILLVRLPLPALDEFDNVAIGIFDHSNGGPRPDGGFGAREGNVRGLQPLDHLVQIGNDKGQVAEAELLVDADGTRARPVRGIDELDITGTETQAMHD